MNHPILRTTTLKISTSPLKILNYQAYICTRCRNYAIKQAQRATIATSASRAAEPNRQLPFSEKLRRKIWGTDTPPGQADPYTKQPKDVKGALASDERVTLENHTLAADSQLDYVPASTWDGLEQIGGATGWWEDAWDKQHQFTGFMTTEKLQSRSDLEDAIRQALIEVYTLAKACLPLTRAVHALDDQIIPDFSGVRFGVRGQRVDVFYPSEQIRQDILDSTSAPRNRVKEVLEAQSESKTSEAAETTDLQSVQETSIDELLLEEEAKVEDLSHEDESFTGRDESWMAVPLGKPAIKFAILKRVMQLTGKRIPDPAIPDIKHGKALLTHLITKPKPMKLAESLLNKTDLLSIPNVQILDRRFTPIDKEKEVGRWKVIEQELKTRGLPVTGNL
ncbi:hypothetical protein MMC14_007162 [Varicellaria rhodocarpa]|nr:hypothetical protein [Varicellaria rhodocarpa]